MFRDTSFSTEDNSSVDLSEVVHELLASIKRETTPHEDIMRAVDAKFDPAQFAAKLLSLIDLESLNTISAISAVMPQTSMVRDAFTQAAFGFYRLTEKQIEIAECILKNVEQHIDSINRVNEVFIYQVSVLTLCLAIPAIDIFANIQPFTTSIAHIFHMGYVKTGGDKSSLQIMATAVSAESRKFRTDFEGSETSTDLDILEQLAAKLAREIVHSAFIEIPATVLSSDEEAIIDSLDLNLTDSYGKSHAISKAIRNIGEKCRRGNANIILTSPKVFESGVFESSTYASISGYDKKSPKIIQHVGTYLGANLYLHPFDYDDHIFFLYKGGQGNTDGAIVHSPYIPLVSCGRVVNPVTFMSSYQYAFRGKNTVVCPDMMGVLTILPKNS